MKQDIKNYYRQQVEKLSADILRLRRRNKLFIMAELASFAAIVLCFVAYATWETGGKAFIAAALLLALYLVIRQCDVRNSSRTARQESLLSMYTHELAYMNGDYTCFADGRQYVDSHHAYTFDLDIFGPDSLFNRINRTITTGGSDFLATELANTRLRSIEQITHRREAINELAAQEPLRADFLAYGQQAVINTNEIHEALRAIRQVSLPDFAGSRLSLAIALTAISGFLLTIGLSAFGTLNSSVPTLWGTLQFFIVLAVCARPVRTISKIVGSIHSQLKAYVNLITLISQSGLKAHEHVHIISQLTTGDNNALRSFHELSSLLDGLDRRGNILGLIIFNTLFLSDYFLVRRFLQWQSRYLSHIDEWIAAVSHFDALVSMGTFRYNEPAATDAVLTDTDGVVFQATGLYHPFLGERAVRNDFRIDDEHYYIITGANMAGKSTFLRSVGVNYILALNGLPVFAERLTVSVFSLFSSMRTTDDLARGISYFNAELLRLQQLIGSCRSASHTLIILDEILKGTNSLDKLNGSRLFLQSISQLPVTGIIATHDLELSRMADEQPARFHNYCFEIQLSDEITYTYRISQGVARNQNATYLLERILEEGL